MREREDNAEQRQEGGTQSGETHGNGGDSRERGETFPPEAGKTRRFSPPQIPCLSTQHTTAYPFILFSRFFSAAFPRSA